MDGRVERGAPKITLLDQRGAVFTVLKNHKLVFAVEFRQGLQ